MDGRLGAELACRHRSFRMCRRHRPMNLTLQRWSFGEQSGRLDGCVAQVPPVPVRDDKVPLFRIGNRPSLASAVSVARRMVIARMTVSSRRPRRWERAASRASGECLVHSVVQSANALLRPCGTNPSPNLSRWCSDVRGQWFPPRAWEGRLYPRSVVRVALRTEGSRELNRSQGGMYI